MQSKERLYSMDNLRATMMWLGIVIHVANLHMVTSDPLPWRDPQKTFAADIIVSVIHAFRMPVFFIVAGFFLSLLVERRGIQGMLQNRLRRLGLPFVVFWPVLFATAVVLTSLFRRREGVALQSGLFDLSVMPLMIDGTRFQTMHLWFLEVLLGLVLFSAIVFGVAARTPERVKAAGLRLFTWFASRGWAFLLLALPATQISRKYPYGVFKASGLMVPLRSEWVFCGLFLMFGICLYHARAQLLSRFQALCWHFALGGAIAFLLALLLERMSSELPPLIARSWFATGLLYNSCGCLWSLALIGGFTRYLNRVSPVMSYVAESSYWAYFMHMPVLVVVDIVMFDWPLHALLKMAINIVVTSAISLASYHLLVRRTAIGWLLNGTPAPAPVRSVARASADGY